MIENVVFTGSGDGGYFYPAFSVAQEIRRRNGQANIVFIGIEQGIEALVAPAAGFPVQFIQANKFSSNPRSFLKPALMDNSGLTQALAVLRKQAPQAVISFGGLASSPVLSAAKMLNIPYIIAEQNLVPGKVNLLMARRSLRILAGFEEIREFFPPSRTVVTGIPVRQEIITRTAQEAREKLNLSPDKFTLLITGAFQGSKTVNNAVIAALPEWKEKDWQILHLVGRENLPEVVPAVEPLVKDSPCSYMCFEYTDDIASLYAAADLVVSRAGSSSMAEITARGIPAVMIPYPYAFENHQDKNARWLEEIGGAVVLPDDEVAEKLGSVVMDLAADEIRRSDMAACSKSAGRPGALTLVVDEIEKALG